MARDPANDVEDNAKFQKELGLGVASDANLYDTVLSVGEHEGATPETLKLAYNTIAPKSSDVGDGLLPIPVQNNESIEKILNHPNMPPEIVQDFLDRTRLNGTDHASDFHGGNLLHHRIAAKHGSTPEVAADAIRSLYNPNNDMDDVPTYLHGGKSGIGPKTYIEYYNQAKTKPNADAQSLGVATKIAYRSLENHNYDPETATDADRDAAIKFFQDRLDSDRSYEQTEGASTDKAMISLVNQDPKLSSEHLQRLADMDRDKDDVMPHITSHVNASPTLLAREADKGKYENLTASSLIALKNPSLPLEARKRAIDKLVAAHEDQASKSRAGTNEDGYLVKQALSRVGDALGFNPALSAEEIAKLMPYHSPIVNHANASDQASAQVMEDAIRGGNRNTVHRLAADKKFSPENVAKFYPKMYEGDFNSQSRRALIDSMDEDTHRKLMTQLPKDAQLKYHPRLFDETIAKEADNQDFSTFNSSHMNNAPEFKPETISKIISSVSGIMALPKAEALDKGTGLGNALLHTVQRNATPEQKKAAVHAMIQLRQHPVLKGQITNTDLGNVHKEVASPELTEFLANNPSRTPDVYASPQFNASQLRQIHDKFIVGEGKDVVDPDMRSTMLEGMIKNPNSDLDLVIDAANAGQGYILGNMPEKLASHINKAPENERVPLWQKAFSSSRPNTQDEIMKSALNSDDASASAFFNSDEVQARLPQILADAEQAHVFAKKYPEKVDAAIDTAISTPDSVLSTSTAINLLLALDKSDAHAQDLAAKVFANLDMCRPDSDLHGFINGKVLSKAFDIQQEQGKTQGLSGLIEHLFNRNRLSPEKGIAEIKQAVAHDDPDQKALRLQSLNTALQSRSVDASAAASFVDDFKSVGGNVYYKFLSDSATDADRDHELDTNAEARDFFRQERAELLRGGGYRYGVHTLPKALAHFYLNGDTSQFTPADKEGFYGTIAEQIPTTSGDEFPDFGKKVLDRALAIGTPAEIGRVVGNVLHNMKEATETPRSTSGLKAAMVAIADAAVTQPPEIAKYLHLALSQVAGTTLLPPSMVASISKALETDTGEGFSRAMNSLQLVKKLAKNIPNFIATAHPTHVNDAVRALGSQPRLDTLAPTHAIKIADACIARATSLDMTGEAGSKDLLSVPSQMFGDDADNVKVNNHILNSLNNVIATTTPLSPINNRAQAIVYKQINNPTLTAAQRLQVFKNTDDEIVAQGADIEAKHITADIVEIATTPAKIYAVSEAMAGAPAAVDPALATTMTNRILAQEEPKSWPFLTRVVAPQVYAGNGDIKAFHALANTLDNSELMSFARANGQRSVDSPNSIEGTNAICNRIDRILSAPADTSTNYSEFDSAIRMAGFDLNDIPGTISPAIRARASAIHERILKTVENFADKYANMPANGWSYGDISPTSMIGNYLSNATFIEPKHLERTLVADLKTRDDKTFSYHASEAVARANIDASGWREFFSNKAHAVLLPSCPNRPAGLLDNLDLTKNFNQDAIDSLLDNTGTDAAAMDEMVSYLVRKAPTQIISALRKTSSQRSFAETLSPANVATLVHAYESDPENNADKDTNPDNLLRFAIRTLVNKGVGGDYTYNWTKAKEGVAALDESPMLKPEDAAAIMAGVKKIGDTTSNLIMNPATPSSVLGKIVEMIDNTEFEDDAEVEEPRGRLLLHPNCPIDVIENNTPETLEEFQPNSRVNSIYFNPVHGNQLICSADSTPILNQLSSDLGMVVDDYVPVKEAIYVDPKLRNRIVAASAVVPHTGMDWISFKRSAKALADVREIKELFLNKEAKKETVMPEDILGLLSHHSKRFSITYTKWTGGQRHNQNKNNLTMQLGLSMDMEQKLKKNPVAWELYHHLAHDDDVDGSGRAELGSHPNRPFGVSWVRMDATDKKGLIIEEFQCDHDRRIRDYLDIDSSPSLKLGKKIYAKAEVVQAAKELQKHIQGWHEASLQAAEEFAKANGYENVYIHGIGTRARLSGHASGGSRSKPPTVWMKQIYETYPPEAGYGECTYKDYPTATDAFVRGVQGQFDKSEKDWHPFWQNMIDTGKTLRCWVKKIK